MDQRITTCRSLRRGVMLLKGMTRQLAVLGLACLAMAAMAPVAMAAMKPPRDVTCPELKETDPTDSTVFQGTAKDLLVPAGHFCQIYGADITKNVILESGSFF